MRLEQYILNELFDTKVPVKYIGLKGGRCTWEFKISEKEYKFMATQYEEDGDWEIQFALMKNNSRWYDYDLTETGDALKVFSGVKACLLDLIKRMSPFAITFSSVGEISRDKLYDRFMSYIPKILKGYKSMGKEYGEYKYIKKGELNNG